MKTSKKLACSLLLVMAVAWCRAYGDVWQDGTPVDSWFSNAGKIPVETLGRHYVITDYGVEKDSTKVQTAKIQHVIDIAAREGGGVVVIPEGTFLSGSLFFRQGTHLHLSANAVLKGSARIEDFPVMQTRIEGETCDYFPALVNADSVRHFTITGSGTIDGNGLHYWREFWIRRQWNPQCTNKDAQRPRLVYISNSSDVTLQDVTLQNSPFWTTHIYKCDHVRYLDCHIEAPTEGIFPQEPDKGAPSSDAIDIDACHHVLVRGCYMHVNDDAVVLKGGKGTYAELSGDNGANYNVIVEHCTFGKVHACLTLGSESLHDYNIIMRDCHAKAADRVLWLKMRPDTPQQYEKVSLENMTGRCGSFLVVRPWTQFFNPVERADMPASYCSDISVRGVRMTCDRFLDMGKSDKYALRRFHMDDIEVTYREGGDFQAEMHNLYDNLVEK